MVLYVFKMGPRTCLWSANRRTFKKLRATAPIEVVLGLCLFSWLRQILDNILLILSLWGLYGIVRNVNRGLSNDLGSALDNTVDMDLSQDYGWFIWTRFLIACVTCFPSLSTARLRFFAISPSKAGNDEEEIEEDSDGLSYELQWATLVYARSLEISKRCFSPVVWACPIAKDKLVAPTNDPLWCEIVAEKGCCHTYYRLPKVSAWHNWLWSLLLWFMPVGFLATSWWS